VLEGLQLVEDDYLGGLGSRGSGKVRFKGIKVLVRTRENYLEDVRPLYEFATLGELLTHRTEVFAKVKQALAV